MSVFRLNQANHRSRCLVQWLRWFAFIWKLQIIPANSFNEQSTILMISRRVRKAFNISEISADTINLSQLQESYISTISLILKYNNYMLTPL